MRYLFLLFAFGLLGTAAHAQSFVHVAPHTVGGTAALTGATLQSFAAIGVPMAGRVDGASSGRVMAFGPWPTYALLRGKEAGTPVEHPDLPASLRLYPNYPNPFNPQTTIRYALPERALVRLAVHDVMGREVAVLVEGHQPAGGHERVFDAGDLPSGAYLYRLEAGRFIRTQTMLLLK